MFGQTAAGTVGLAGGADPATMPDQGVAEESPLLPGKDLDEVAFDLDGVFAVLA